MSFAPTIIVCSRKELQTKYAEALNALEASVVVT